MSQGSLFEDVPSQQRIVLIDDHLSGKAIYYPNFFTSNEADEYFELCNSEEVPWKREKISMYGNEYLVPRDTAWFSKDGLAYTYSGIKMDPDPYPEFVTGIIII